MSSVALKGLGIAILATLPVNAITALYPNTDSTCKCIPGDTCWPTVEEWADFNTTLGGKLVTPYQLAYVCHDPFYDEAACEYLKQEWTEPWIHDGSSSSIMAAAVANESCDPFTASELPCKTGDTVTYAVNASDATDFAKTIAFAQARNIRLVIRNTGHDYLGKSTGKWALSIWTHHMKNTEYMPRYNSSSYTGPAIRLGAGIQVEEAYETANTYGLLTVGGDCETVGVVGGYLQGGGHSALSSIYGIAADHILEWEVVDGTGRLLTATPSNNHSDLYWAMSGGGGGTYAIATSAVVKLFDDMPMVGVQLEFELDTQQPDSFYNAVSKYHEMIPDITAVGGMAIAEITNSTFLLTPLTLPNGSRSEAGDLLAPLTSLLNTTGLAYSLNVTEEPSWLTYWQKTIKPNPTQLVQNAQYGGWMVPHSVLQENNTALQSAIREITSAGCAFVGLAVNVSLPDTQDVTLKNSVLPAWRDAAMNVILSTPWPEGADLALMRVRAETMTHTCVPALAKLAPDAGAYLNEADPNQPDWQRAFYGVNYDRLLAIKDKYDPAHVFYGATAVGSDRYSVDSDGRLCRVA